MQKSRILWADDEIDLLKPHIIFLEKKNYEVVTVTSGDDAVDKVDEEYFDIVFLDENMPGLRGLETLRMIKAKKPNLPVIMITKSEEEHIMEDAIGSKIADYLIKPVNPNQILLTLKKHLESKKLVHDKSTSEYQREFRSISMRLMERLDFEEWTELFKDLNYWELELEKGDASMMEILMNQKAEANQLFSKFIEEEYVDWLRVPAEAPIMSHNAFSKLVAPLLKKKVCLLVIDNLRWDQWQIIKPFVQEFYRVEEEESYMSILPTATHYARNAFFAGLMPAEIKDKFPDEWKTELDKGSKNASEDVYLEAQLKRLGLNQTMKYFKITNLAAGKKLVDQFENNFNSDLTVVVYNFVDMLSHARTEMEVIRELADNEAAYRSLTESWFKNSPLYELCEKLSNNDIELIITTDHGTINVNDYTKVIGDKNTNTNLRYKFGRGLTYEEKEVFKLTPEEAQLPRENVNSIYLFAKEDKFFVYPNKLNYYKEYYMRTFQHGGVSMEEMIIPFIYLTKK